MDYSKFVDAVLNDDREELNHISPIITRVLIKFLIARLDASPEDAEDSSQNSLLHTIEKIRQDRLKNPEVIIYYLFTTAKNDYIKQQNKNNKLQSLNPQTTPFQREHQLDGLLEKERYEILKHCLSKLNKSSFEYINYWFENPDMDTDSVASYFNISVNNAWIKKHRIIKTLKECVQKNSKH